MTGYDKAVMEMFVLMFSYSQEYKTYPFFETVSLVRAFLKHEKVMSFQQKK